MSDPTERTHANPHPVSGHRTPAEIAEDEAGPIGQSEEGVGARGVPTAPSQQSDDAIRRPVPTAATRTGKITAKS
jgi:hypothetical protein